MRVYICHMYRESIHYKLCLSPYASLNKLTPDPAVNNYIGKVELSDSSTFPNLQEAGRIGLFVWYLSKKNLKRDLFCLLPAKSESRAVGLAL